ncbi:MAG: tyrosine-protein phosphatase [Flavobacteriaceae bacterium]
MTQQFAIEGSINFRPVHDLDAGNGRKLRAGALYRGGSYEKLTEQGIAQLHALGINTIFDLRTNTEREEFRSRLADREGFVTHVEPHDIRIGDLSSVLRDPASTAAESRAAMLNIYQNLPKVFVPVFRRYFALLGETESPIAVNCTVGKDRTGAAVALLLSALGVARDDIIEEYAKTNERLDDIRETLEARKGERGYSGANADVLLPVLAADPDYMAAMLSVIEGSHGGVPAYLESEIGVDAAGAERLRRRFLTD